MRSLEDSLEYGRTMLEQLAPYLRSKEIFWPLGVSPSSGGDPFPKMSLGALALVFDELRVQAEELTPEQVQQYQELEGQFEQAKEERPANLEVKTLAEMRQRLNLWKAYIQDLRESRAAATSYPTDVRHRVLLTRLRTFVTDHEALDDLQARLEPIDARLRAVFRSGPFVWHPRLRHLYDEREYWFLYGRPVPQQS